MADLNLTAAVEAAARALVAHDGEDWNDLSDIRTSTEAVRNSYRRSAEVALRAGAPLIAETIARAIEARRNRLATDDVWENEGRAYLDEAAAIARRAGDGTATP